MEALAVCVVLNLLRGKLGSLTLSSRGGLRLAGLALGGNLAAGPAGWCGRGRSPRRTPRPPPALSINKMAINKMAH